MYRNLIFDVDGTLVDTSEVFIPSLQQLLRERLGWEKTREELLFVFGIPGIDAMKQLGVPDVEEYVAAWDRLVEQNSGRMRLYPGVEQLLRQLESSGRYTLGVITSRTRPEVERDFPRLGLSRYFHQVVCSSDTARHKPDKEPMEKMLANIGGRAEETIFVGDTIYDRQCAQGAGVRFALAGWGALTQEGIHPDFLLQKPQDFLSLLNSFDQAEQR